MKKRTFTEELPKDFEEIIFKTKDNLVFIGAYYENSDYIVGHSCTLIEQDILFDDIIWWCYTSEL